MKRSDWHSRAGKLGYQKAKIKLLEYARWSHRKAIKDHNSRHKLCKYCRTPIDFDHRFNMFCNRSCSMSYNNTHKPKKLIPAKFCLACGTLLKMQKHKTQKTCSVACWQTFIWGKQLSRIKLGKVKSDRVLKRFLVEKYGNKCMLCGWNQKNKYTGNIPVEIHHKDGNSTNCIPRNLMLICPNCHSLTKHYKGLNRGRGRYRRRLRYQLGKSY